MGTATSHVPPGIRQVFRYSVTDSSPASTRTPHRGLPSTTLTLVFATDAPLLCSYDQREWASGEGVTHNVCLGAFHLQPVYLHRPDRQEGVQVAVHPLAARQLLGLPAAALTELTQEGEDAIGVEMRHLFARVASASPADHSDLVADGLRGLADRNANRSGPRREVAGAWLLLERSGGRMGITDVADQVGLTTRHLSTLVKAELGIGTKQLADLFRFEAAHHSVVSAVDAGNPLRLADIAHAHGYADHAHMDQAYRRYTGTSPTGWLSDEGRRSVGTDRSGGDASLVEQ